MSVRWQCWSAVVLPAGPAGVTPGCPGCPSRHRARATVIPHHQVLHLGAPKTAEREPMASARSLALFRFLRVVGWNIEIWQQWQVLPRVLRGMKRTLGAAVRPKLPITPLMLIQFVRLLNPTGPSLVLWCAILVGFFGFFRKGHLCVDGISLADVSMAVLRRRHFVFDPVGYCVRITVVASKTNHFFYQPV